MKLQEISTRVLLSLFSALVFASAMCPTEAHAQIIDQLEVAIPFQFHAGNAKFPSGKYSVQYLDDSDLGIMEIRSADGSTSALFEVHSTQASSTPAKNELIFNKYGNRYFLAKLYEQGSAAGSEVFESRYEKRIGQAAADAQEHVPASVRAQGGN